jgi:hypothetical protein
VLRKDIIGTVKQCDGKLSNLLQTFQVCHQSTLIVCFNGVTHGLQLALIIDERLEQIKVIKDSRACTTYNDLNTPPPVVTRACASYNNLNTPPPVVTRACASYNNLNTPPPVVTPTTRKQVRKSRSRLQRATIESTVESATAASGYAISGLKDARPQRSPTTFKWPICLFVLFVLFVYLIWTFDFACLFFLSRGGVAWLARLGRAWQK